MAKVKLIGEVKAEFEVKFGLSEDITIEIAKTEGGTVLYYGKGDLEKVSEKALSFVADRIRYFLEKNKIKLKYDEDVIIKMSSRSISPIKEINYCKHILYVEKYYDTSIREVKKNEVKEIYAIRYVAENKVFLLNRDYMKLYFEILKKYEELKNREDICFI
jgi:hypothetical protein